MRKGRSVGRKLGWVVLLAMTALLTVGLATVADDECYTDVRISGTGYDWLDGSYPFIEMYGDRPVFGSESGEFVQPKAIPLASSHMPMTTEWQGVVIVYDFEWLIEAEWTDGISFFYVTFRNDSDSLTPPASGWELCWCNIYMVSGFPYTGLPSAPTLSGGQPCAEPDPLVVTALGVGGSFLDRCLDLAEGEEAPMAGLCPLSAIYSVGELVTGSCSICDLSGSVVRGSYVHVYAYSVDIAARPEEKTLLDHWTVHFDATTGTYSYSWDTTETAPGTYDIYLAFPDGSGHTCRVQLTEPIE